MRFLGSVKALYAAVGVLFLTYALGFYLDARSSSMQRQYLEVSTGLEKIMRLRQEANNMLLVAVLDKNLLHASGYDTVNHDLGETIGTVVALTKTLRSSTEIAALDDSNRQRQMLEASIIDLIQAGKWGEARETMFGDAYVLSRKTNEIDIETAVSGVMGELSATADSYGRINTTTLIMRGVALLLLVWVGIAFSRRSRADLAEQIRLGQEIAAAKETLEERVKARTADLEDRTRQLAQENEDRLKSEMRTHLILKSVGEGIFGIDTEGRITFLNDAAGQLLGYARDELNGEAVHDVIHHSYADGTPYPSESCPVHLACTRGEVKQVGNEVFWRKDGSSFQTEYSVTPIIDGRGDRGGAVLVFRDITEQKNSEEELMRRLKELERFNRLTVSRETRMIELKKEINEALELLGREKKYTIVE